MDKKFTPLAILEILKEDSDENNIVTIDVLLNKLKNRYKITVDRRTIYSNINALIDLGYDISTFKDNRNGYYLGTREFEPSEITLLCNAIHSSRYISSKYSKDLIDKLLNTQGKSFKGKYNDEVYLPNTNKKDNKDFFLNIDILSEAIVTKKVISFNYVKYNFNKKPVKQGEERRIFSPHHLVYSNDKLYLIGYSVKYDKIIHYRVDRMIEIEIEEDLKFVKERSKKDPYEYAKTKLYMYAGEDYEVTLRCKNVVLDDIIESFGQEITILKDGPDHFKAHVKSSKQGIIYFALQYLENIEVLSPKEIKNDIKKIINDAAKRYS